MNEVLQKIYEIGIVPVIAIEDADQAVPLAKALVKAAFPRLRSPSAPQRQRKPSAAL